MFRLGCVSTQEQKKNPSRVQTFPESNDKRVDFFWFGRFWPFWVGVPRGTLEAERSASTLPPMWLLRVFRPLRPAGRCRQEWKPVLGPYWQFVSQTAGAAP